jgi:hypothetical protein
MLGFRQAIFPVGEYVSDWVADVKKGLNSLYVYCPLVEPRMVGDAQVPLLRIVPVEGRDPQELLKDQPSEKRPAVGRPRNGTHRMIFSDKNGTCTKSELDLFQVPPTPMIDDWSLDHLFTFF